MWFFGLIVVLLIGAVAVVASGRWGAMSTAYDDRPDLSVPARQTLTATDIESARFGVGLRGYRMDEVDTLLERVAREVAERDRRIADLERAVSPIIDGPGFPSGADYDPSDFDDTGVQKPIMVGGDFPESEANEPDTAEQTAIDQPAEAPAANSPAADAPLLARGLLTRLRLRLTRRLLARLRLIRRLLARPLLARLLLTSRALGRRRLPGRLVRVGAG